MFYTGALLLGYLLKHLYDFRFDHRFFDAPAAGERRSRTLLRSEPLPASRL